MFFESIGFSSSILSAPSPSPTGNILDIVIYTKRDVLYHKKGNEEYYWEMSRPPKNFRVGDKVYFAVNKNVVGFFTSIEFNTEKDDHETIVWHGKSWQDITPIPVKPFRGFRYKWW